MATVAPLLLQPSANRPNDDLMVLKAASSLGVERLHTM